MILKVQEKCPFSVEEGVVMDFVDGQWVILIKDEVWQDEERKAFRRNAGKFSFFPLDTVVFFTVNIDDVLETSDLPFMIQDCEWADQLISQPEQKVTLALLDKEDTVLELRQLTLPHKETVMICERLKAILDQEFAEEVSCNQIDRTQMKFQPYEMEEKALFSVSF